MIFADASALIAIITGESAADLLADALEADAGRLCSAMAVWETVAGLCRSHALPIPTARERVARFLEVGRFRVVGIAEQEMQLAIEAYAQYGKGRHPAALNMGDCFAYACAKVHGAKLLYTGNDFTRTDLA